MHGVSAAQGRQRSLSITATPMTCARFSRQRERRDRARRADLAAGVAGVVAVAEARPEDRRPEALEAGLRQRRLEAGGRADLHALAAAQAAGEEAAFVLGARRPDQARALDGARDAGAEENGGADAGADREHRLAAAGVVLGPRPRAGRRRASCRPSRGQATRQSRHIVHSELTTRASGVVRAAPLVAGRRPRSRPPGRRWRRRRRRRSRRSRPGAAPGPWTTRPSSAPSGQRYRHQKRSATTFSRTTASRSEEEADAPARTAAGSSGSTEPRKWSSTQVTTPTVGPQLMPARSSASTT